MDGQDSSRARRRGAGPEAPGPLASRTAGAPAPGRRESRFVDGYLLYLLAAVSHAASGQFHARVRAAGLRVPEWRVLATLVDCDGAMVTRLAETALIEQSHLTKIVAQMEDKGLVQRDPDPEDRRRVRVRLTAAGRSLALRLVAEARSHEAGLLDRFPQAEGERLKSALADLLVRLRAA